MLNWYKFNIKICRKNNLIFFRYEYSKIYIYIYINSLKPTYLGTPSLLFEEDKIKNKKDQVIFARTLIFLLAQIL